MYSSWNPIDLSMEPQGSMEPTLGITAINQKFFHFVSTADTGTCQVFWRF